MDAWSAERHLSLKLQDVVKSYRIQSRCKTVRWSSLENLAHKLAIDGQVFFIGFRDDVADLVQASSIAVMSSVREGFSISLLEYMAMGKPIVATDVGGNKEAVIDGLCGLIVPPANSEALAKAILTLLQDDTNAKKFGKSARERFMSEFTLDTMVSHYENLYDSLYQIKV
jgi:glycosyltransferase involved in cell wall biosynthesis